MNRALTAAKIRVEKQLIMYFSLRVLLLERTVIS